MVTLYGAKGLTKREQAQALLKKAAQLCWGMDSLPEHERGERGKPYFPGFPSYHFNLSHSGTWALCALSEHPVGVDIQVVRTSWPPRLVERTCTPEELAWLKRRGDCSEDFAALWACKESAGKECGYGLPYPPSRQTVPLSVFDETVAQDAEGRFFHTYAGPGWRGAVCAWERPPEEIIWLSYLE